MDMGRSDGQPRLCNLEFYKKAEMTDINKNIYHLYLGYNFKKVKVGTQYVVKQEDGKDDVYVVDGILKNTRILFPGNSIWSSSRNYRGSL